MKKITYLILITFMTAFVFSCAEDGDPGPTGTDGVDGVDGEDGEDGVGFEELTEDGNVMVYYDGTLPDGTAFKDTVNFKYTIGIFSTVQYDSQDSVDVVEVVKFKDPAFPIYEYGSYFIIDFEVDTLLSSGGFVLDDITLVNFYKTDDFNAYYIGIGDVSTDDITISNYSYSADTGMLKFNFAFTSAEDENSTDYELKVSGMVNVKVYRADMFPS